MKEVYVTFAVPHLFQQDEKYAVKCLGMDQAREVANDACSFDGIKNIRLRKCGRPSKRLVLGYGDYWNYSQWY